MMTIIYKDSPVKDVLDHFEGEPYVMAEALKVTPGAVYQWLDSGYLPANRAIQVERLTKGKFKAIHLVR